MAFPSPNAPTIADLQYNAYNPGGSLNTTAFVPPYNISVSDAINSSESLTPQFVGYTGNLAVSDFLNTAEQVALTLDPTGPNQYSINVSDSTVTSESVSQYEANYVPNVSDSTTTSESISTLISPLKVSDSITISESIHVTPPA